MPVLTESKEYKRAVGYFSSTILIEYISSLKDFYLNNGKMKLIISPNLSKVDIEALVKSEDYIVESNEMIERQLLEYFSGDSYLKVASELFFQLIVGGILEVKIAVPKNDIGLFHDKIAVFYSKDSDEKIAISGSNNETYNSVSINHESFNTFCSWKEGQEDYVAEHERDFDEYWEDETPSLKVFSLERAIVDNILKENEFTCTIRENFAKLEQHSRDKRTKRGAVLDYLDFIPYDYQSDAARKLLDNNGGILEFATGSGKTKTAVYYMELLKQKYSKAFFVVVVPDMTLMLQWYKELSNYNINIVKCYSDNPGWIKDFRTMIDIYNVPMPSYQVAIVTNQTMFRKGKDNRFLKQLKHISGRYTMIVDEVHNWSTELITNNLPPAKEKVALSATPFNDPQSIFDMKIDKYFGGIVAKYSLKDAIEDGRLVPYNYIPIFVELTTEEKEDYLKLTSKMMSMRGANKKKKDKGIQKMIERLLFARARIVYGAANKLNELEQKLRDAFFEDEHLLIYCGATSYQEMEKNEETTVTQVKKVNDILARLNLKAAQYTQSEGADDRENAIKLFKEKTLSTLVAIKCLDEGVDIPEIKNAIILASSTNRREFIQRRGRVLRRSPGKHSANIYDFIVYDPTGELKSMNTNERRRFVEFSGLSLNYKQLMTDNKKYMEGYNDDSLN